MSRDRFRPMGARQNLAFYWCLLFLNQVTCALSITFYNILHISLFIDMYLTNVSIRLLLLFIFLYFSKAWMKITLCNSTCSLPCPDPV